MPRYILALDAGTTSSRALLFDHEGAICGLAQREFQQIYPQAGWVEHDAQEIWASQISVAVEALSRAQVQASEVSALGITNQRETAILWNRSTGHPIGHAIVWQDRRTAGICEDLRQRGLADTVQARTGLLIDAYFSASKVMWMLDHVPDARRAAEAGELAFGTVDSWLIWNLTGGRVHATDVTNASRTMLFNIHKQQWDEELLNAMGIPRAILPEVLPSSGMFGEVSNSLGLEGIPICGVAGDQHAALFGQTCFTKGMGKCTYGTGAFLLENCGEEARASKHRLLTTIAWKRGGENARYALEGSVFVAGSVVQWLRDGLRLIHNSRDVEALAAGVPDNGGVHLIPAFTGLGAPHWDPHARGLMIGMTRGTQAGHIARAALESIVSQTADLLEAMELDSGTPLGELRVDGGASANNLLMQMQADLLGIRVVRPSVIETTSLGAAYLAGLGCGFWKNTEEVAGQWKVDRVFEPEEKGHAAARERHGHWRRALERAKAWESGASGA